MENEILDHFEEGEGEVRPMRFAGFWVRVGATIIDFFILLPIIAFGMYNMLNIKSLALFFAITLLHALYKPFMEYNYGATLGKMALKLKVVNTQFGAITLNQAILRFGFQILGIFASLFSTIALFSNPEFYEITNFMELGEFQQTQGIDYMTMGANFLGLIAVIVVAFDERKQGLHDKIAQTYCVHRD